MISLQIGQEQILNKALEESLLLGVLVCLIIAAGFWIWNLNKEKNTIQNKKDELVKESLGLITLVESQLVENKASNELLLKNSTEVLTEIKLIKQLIQTKE